MQQTERESARSSRAGPAAATANAAAIDRNGGSSFDLPASESVNE